MMDDLDADVARLREKWFGKGSKPVLALDAEEQAIAAKWIGKTEAKRLAQSTGGRRYRPPVPIGHYGYIPRGEPDRWTALTAGDYWYVEVFQSGKARTVFRGERAPALKAVAKLQRMGVSVTRVGSERSPEELAPADGGTKPQRSRRFDIMNKLKDFTP